VALILAVNPGNSHNSTLARLARELKGCELIGAESCAVAITAMKGRMPDVVLLPAKRPQGEAALMAHIKSVGGVLTLKLPPVTSADPIALANQIREMLTGVAPIASEPAAPTTSPDLLRAATAAITWIRTRRAQWATEQFDFAPEPLAQTAGGTYETHEPYEPDEPYEPNEPYEPYEPIEVKEPYDPYPMPPPRAVEPPEPVGPSMFSRAADTASGLGESVAALLPRVAALAVTAGVAGAGFLYWPQIQARITSTLAEFNKPGEPSPRVDTNPNPVVPQRGAKPTGEPDPIAKVSGWVAVFAPFEVTISEGATGVQVDDRGRAMLAPGRHRLRFQNRELGYDETRTVDVRPTATTTINLIPQTTISVTANETADVLIDGTRAGVTPYKGTIPLGTHTVTVKTTSAERQLTVSATSKPVQLQVDFSQP
jgi:hypothetical protein